MWVLETQVLRLDGRLFINSDISLSPQPAFPFPSPRLTQMNTLTLETKGVKVAEPPNAKDQESEISNGGKWPPAQTKTPLSGIYENRKPLGYVNH